MEEDCSEQLQDTTGAEDNLLGVESDEKAEGAVGEDKLDEDKLLGDSEDHPPEGHQADAGQVAETADIDTAKDDTGETGSSEVLGETGEGKTEVPAEGNSEEKSVVTMDIEMAEEGDKAGKPEGEVTDEKDGATEVKKVEGEDSKGEDVEMAAEAAGAEEKGTVA